MTIRNDATRQRIRVRETRRLRSVVPRQGQVLLDTDIDGLARLALDRIETADADTMGAPGRLVVPAVAPGFAVSAVSLAGGTLDCTIGVGRGYLDGWLVENQAAFTLSATSGPQAQPHPHASPAVAGSAVVGLKSVIRLIDPVEETALADRALGDAQASGRSIVDWQAFVLPTAAPIACADVLALPAWQDVVRPSTGRLQFIKAAPAASTDPCSLSESGGYTRLENLLYRVEIHRGVVAAGAPDVAIDGPRYRLQGLQLKLSRCNGSILARIDKVDGKVFTVSPAALDPRNWFAKGQLAELVSIHDDVDTLAGHQTERLFRVSRVRDDEVELVDRSTTDTVVKVNALADGTWFLRMWESLPDASEVATVALDGTGSHSTVINLGDGIAIQLEGDAAARFRRGDYWTCAMRADGEIEWIGGQYELPAGPQIRYAPLAAVNAGPASEDCRIVPATLADRLLLYRGGDGQEAMPDPTQPTRRVPLASPLRVAVMRGEQPVAGAKVVFEVKDLPAGKTAQLAWQPPSGPIATGNSVTVTADATGLAQIAWEIDPTVPVQRVRATLVAPAAAPATTPLIFTANLSRAAQVGFDPKAIPVFVGITDVQRALEALAGMQQAGCATYVLTPNNWLDVLAKLKSGESAKLCFQRGTFRTEATVMLSKLGHISMCGAGDATIITVDKGECAIAFEACASVHLGHVSMASPDGATSKGKGAHIAGRGGTVTAIDCPVVEIVDASFACGAQALTERTCITVRGSEGKPLRSVRIANNRLDVGFAQDGILVIEATLCVIEGNQIAAAALPEKFDRGRVLLSRAFQPALVKALVSRAIGKKGRSRAAETRLVKAGAFQVSFVSDVPQPVWDDLTANNPPAATDLKSADAVRNYVDRIFQRAAGNDEIVKKYKPDVARLEKETNSAFSREIRASLLKTGNLRVTETAPAARAPSPPTAATGSVRTDVSVPGLPAFSSILNASGWQALLRLAPRANQQPPSAIVDVERAARMSLADAGLRAKIPGLGKWFDGKAEALSAYARQAITVAGKAVGDAVVSGNRITGFAQAVHVGASFEESDRVFASFGSVTVAGNIATFETIGDSTYSPAGIFVGNADTVRISDNLLEPPAGERRFVNIGHGIRVWGKIGRFLAIEKNRVGIGRIAIAIKGLHVTDEEAPGLMWLAADNLGSDHASADVLRAPKWVERRFNRP